MEVAEEERVFGGWEVRRIVNEPPERFETVLQRGGKPGAAEQTQSLGAGDPAEAGVKKRFRRGLSVPRVQDIGAEDLDDPFRQVPEEDAANDLLFGIHRRDQAVFAPGDHVRQPPGTIEERGQVWRCGILLHEERKSFHTFALCRFQRQRIRSLWTGKFLHNRRVGFLLGHSQADPVRLLHGDMKAVDGTGSDHEAHILEIAFVFEGSRGGDVEAPQV